MWLAADTLARAKNRRHAVAHTYIYAINAAVRQMQKRLDTCEKTDVAAKKPSLKPVLSQFALRNSGLKNVFTTPQRAQKRGVNRSKRWLRAKLIAFNLYDACGAEGQWPYQRDIQRHAAANGILELLLATLEQSSA